MKSKESGQQIIDVIQAAHYLGISTGALERWIRQGGVPYQSFWGRYTFEINALREWARSKNMAWLDGLSNTQLESVDLVQSFFAGGIVDSVSGTDFKAVLLSITELVSLPLGTDRKELLKRLLEREAMASTGLGKGVAVPHPRYPLSESIKVPLIVTCFAETPVNYNAVDQLPVFVFFLMLSPNTKLHLQLLSQLSYCLREDVFIDFLRTKPDMESLCNQINQIRSQRVKR